MSKRSRRQSAAPPAPSRIVLHAPMTNFYWVIITMAVIALVALPGALVGSWKQHQDSEILWFGALGSLVLILAIAYCQRKARWVVADARGLTITERSRVRVVPWSEVRCLLDLGWLGGGPNARRHYVEFADGEAFTFLADTDAMARLDGLRGRWKVRAAR